MDLYYNTYFNHISIFSIINGHNFIHSYMCLRLMYYLQLISSKGSGLYNIPSFASRTAKVHD